MAAAAATGSVLVRTVEPHSAKAKQNEPMLDGTHTAHEQDEKRSTASKKIYTHIRTTDAFIASDRMQQLRETNGALFPTEDKYHLLLAREHKSADGEFTMPLHATSVDETKYTSYIQSNIVRLCLVYPRIRRTFACHVTQAMHVQKLAVDAFTVATTVEVNGAPMRVRVQETDAVKETHDKFVAFSDRPLDMDTSSSLAYLYGISVSHSL